MTVVEEEFMYAQPDSWNTAAAATISYIHNYSKNVGGSIEEMRATLDEFINMNNSYPLDEPFSFMRWRALGAISLNSARQAGVINSENEGHHEEDFVNVLVKKQTDYGHDNINRFGRVGLMVRIHDKIARLENLTRRGVDPKNESLFDNYMDVINYCAIGMMVEYEWFMLNLEEE